MRSLGAGKLNVFQVFEPLLLPRRRSLLGLLRRGGRSGGRLAFFAVLEHPLLLRRQRSVAPLLVGDRRSDVTIALLGRGGIGGLVLVANTGAEVVAHVVRAILGRLVFVVDHDALEVLSHGVSQLRALHLLADLVHLELRVGRHLRVLDLHGTEVGHLGVYLATEEHRRDAVAGDVHDLHEQIEVGADDQEDVALQNLILARDDGRVTTLFELRPEAHDERVALTTVLEGAVRVDALHERTNAVWSRRDLAIAGRDAIEVVSVHPHTADRTILATGLRQVVHVHHEHGGREELALVVDHGEQLRAALVEDLPLHEPRKNGVEAVAFDELIAHVEHLFLRQQQAGEDLEL